MFEFIFAVMLIAGLGALFGGKKGALGALRVAVILFTLFVVGFVIYGFQPSARDPQFNNWGSCRQHGDYCFPKEEQYLAPDVKQPKTDPNEIPVPKGARSIG